MTHSQWKKDEWGGHRTWSCLLVRYGTNRTGVLTSYERPGLRCCAHDISIPLFPDGSVGTGKKIHLLCGRHRRHGFSPWVGKIHQRRKWQPIPIFLLENSMDRGAWQAGATESWTRLNIQATCWDINAMHTSAEKLFCACMISILPITGSSSLLFHTLSNLMLALLLCLQMDEQFLAWIIRILHSSSHNNSELAKRFSEASETQLWNFH